MIATYRYDYFVIEAMAIRMSFSNQQKRLSIHSDQLRLELYRILLEEAMSTEDIQKTAVLLITWEKDGAKLSLRMFRST